MNNLMIKNQQAHVSSDLILSLDYIESPDQSKATSPNYIVYECSLCTLDEMGSQQIYGFTYQHNTDLGYINIANVVDEIMNTAKEYEKFPDMLEFMAAYDYTGELSELKHGRQAYEVCRRAHEAFEEHLLPAQLEQIEEWAAQNRTADPDLDIDIF